MRRRVAAQTGGACAMKSLSAALLKHVVSSPSCGVASSTRQHRVSIYEPAMSTSWSRAHLGSDSENASQFAVCPYLRFCSVAMAYHAAQQVRNCWEVENRIADGYAAPGQAIRGWRGEDAVRHCQGLRSCCSEGVSEASSEQGAAPQETFRMSIQLYIVKSQPSGTSTHDAISRISPSLVLPQGFHIPRVAARMRVCASAVSRREPRTTFGSRTPQEAEAALVSQAMSGRRLLGSSRAAATHAAVVE